MKQSFGKNASMAGILAAALILGLLPGCTVSSNASADQTAADALYTPGTYTGVGKGMDGDVTAVITVDDHSITDVQLDVSGETEGIGAAAGDELTKQILEKQSADIDGVSGATVTSTGIEDAVRDALAQASGTASAADAGQLQDLRLLHLRPMRGLMLCCLKRKISWAAV